MQIRYHLDEDVSHAFAVGLRRRGIDVTTSTDVGLIGATDLQQLSFAMSQNRVLITHDSDHLRLHAQGISHAGIAYSHRQRSSVGQMVLSLVALYRVFEAEQMQGMVEFL